MTVAAAPTNTAVRHRSIARAALLRDALIAGVRPVELDEEAMSPRPADIAWIDDLGLRMFDSPRVAFESAIGEQGTAAADVMVPGAAVISQEALADLAWSQPALVGDVLGCLVDDLGDYAEAAQIAGIVAGALLGAGSIDGRSFSAAASSVRAAWGGTVADRVRLAVRAASVLAMQGDARCLELFDLVAAGSAAVGATAFGATAIDSALARMRAAVAHVKRLGSDVATASAAIDAAELAARGIVHAGDRACVGALVGNLRALTFVQARDGEGARAAVTEAWHLVASRDLCVDELAPSFVDEVRAQVLSNLAVVVGTADGWPAAVELYRRGVEIAIDAAPALKMETATLLGYALFRAGELGEARTVLLDADAHAAQTSAPTQRAQIWKLLAVVEADIGDAAASDAWLARLS